MLAAKLALKGSGFLAVSSGLTGNHADFFTLVSDLQMSVHCFILGFCM